MKSTYRTTASCIGNCLIIPVGIGRVGKEQDCLPGREHAMTPIAGVANGSQNHGEQPWPVSWTHESSITQSRLSLYEAVVSGRDSFQKAECKVRRRTLRLAGPLQYG